MRRSPVAGRPAATSHVEIEQAAFSLFAQRGFDATTLDDIAASIGVSRRTVTRYYPSKSDIPWGQFDQTLEGFAQLLREAPAEAPLWERVHHGVVAFNDFPVLSSPSHRARMQLILQTPALQAHSVLRYREWRQVIEGFVATQLDTAETGPLPQLVGHVSLALAMHAYEQWLVTDPGDPCQDHRVLGALLSDSMRDLRRHLA